MLQRPPALLPQYVIDIMILCGIPDDDQPVPNPNNLLSTAQRIATKVFMNEYEKCLEMTFEDLEKDLQILSRDPDRPIFMASGLRTKLKAFIEWTKQCFRCGFLPERTIFNPNNSIFYIRQANIHNDFINRAKLMAGTAKPPQFKPTDNWANWSPLLVNFLR